MKTVSILSISKDEVKQHFFEEFPKMRLSDKQLIGIGELVEQDMFQYASSEFYEQLQDAIKDAAMQVLHLEFDESYNIVKEK